MLGAEVERNIYGRFATKQGAFRFGRSSSARRLSETFFSLTAMVSPSASRRSCSLSRATRTLCVVCVTIECSAARVVP